MKSLSEDVKDLMVAASLGIEAGITTWGIYIGLEPDTPDNCITIYDSGGRPPGYYFNKDLPETQYPGFQVRVRGLDYAAVYAKISAIKDMLNKKGAFTTTGDDATKYGRIFQTSAIISLGRQKKKLRHVLVVNFETMREDAA